jgi:endonuclease-8
MPEGPEIRRAADTLAAAIVDHRLLRVWFAYAKLKPYEKTLQGRRIEAIARQSHAAEKHGRQPSFPLCAGCQH